MGEFSFLAHSSGTLNVTLSSNSAVLPAFHCSTGRRYPTILLYTSHLVRLGVDLAIHSTLHISHSELQSGSKHLNLSSVSGSLSIVEPHSGHNSLFISKGNARSPIEHFSLMIIGVWILVTSVDYKGAAHGGDVTHSGGLQRLECGLFPKLPRWIRVMAIGSDWLRF